MTFVDQMIADFQILGPWLAVFILVAIAELRWPARRAPGASPWRVPVNFGLGLLNMALAGALSLSAVAAALVAAQHGWGLFNQISTPWPLVAITLLLARSLLDYALHWTFHRINWLWPLHAVHHRDDAVDLSTTLRAHPGSAIIVAGANAALILVLGPSAAMTLAIDFLMFSAALLQHGNVQMPDAVSRRLERALVTPRMHLVHHGAPRDLHDSNYGAILTVWDHLFGTYREPPAAPFRIGLEPPPANE